ADTASISEALALLTTRATNLRQEIDKTAQAIQERLAEKGKAGDPGARAGGEPGEHHSRARGETPAAQGPSSAEREAIAQLKEAWEAKKAQIKDVQSTRERRVAELQTRLAELRSTYAGSHPLIVETLRTIDTLSG